MGQALLKAWCWLALVTASATSGLSDDAASGRRIFVQGGTSDELSATFGAGTTPLPPRLRRCAGCHGADGLGRREGGIGIPAITWRALTAPREATAARPGRPAYDRPALIRALGEGIDPAGRRLASGMPRFRLSPTQAAALIDYIGILGTEADHDPGVTADEIRIGAVLPLSGPAAAAGRAIRTGLENALAEAGAIYGRRLRLIAADGGNDVNAALHALTADDQVFALVATMLPAGVERIEDEDVPVIGPLRPSVTHPASNMFDLLAPREDQMRVLVDELTADVTRARRLVICGADGSIADAVADQARRRGATIIRIADAAELPALLSSRAPPSPDAIIALPDIDFGRLAMELADQPGGWLIAGAAEALTPAQATDERLRLVLPIWPASPHHADSSPLATAASIVLIEGLKRMGARASRAGLIAALESLREFPTGVLPPLTFSKSRHTGSSASVVIRPDRSSGAVTLGTWRAPRPFD
ncbi:ABC transporter substrate-binding protein [Bradyrhizobium oligotrophicum]|uniref:cytochrome c/ABC transporter substrate-binding protein n=1 Tax=Bradyrhizobium oligotrophicum TaxID=44255 RepID=UPI003EC12DDE